MKLFHLAVFVIASTSMDLNAQSNQTVTGNLTVNGNSDFEGNVATFGSFNADPSNAGLVLQYGEASGVSTITFDAMREVNTWYWRHDGTLGAVNTMTLDNDHKLTIFQSDGTTAGVVLNPDGSSTFVGSLVVNGTDSKLPNQTLTGSTSIITQGLGDGRYLRQGSSTLVYGSGSSASNGNSVAAGLNAVAEGGASSSAIALGADVSTTVTTDGRGSVAIGWGAEAGTSERGNAIALGTRAKALGDDSLAVGYEAETYDYNSIALGFKAKANQGNAIAIGSLSEATGFHSVAFGRSILATGFAQLAVGTYNLPDPLALDDEAVPEAAIFQVGNGSDSEGRSNAFEVKWNGDAKVSGSLDVGGIIRVEPKGGISMGDFTAE
jgi:hypothetical protein